MILEPGVLQRSSSTSCLHSDIRSRSSAVPVYVTVRCLHVFRHSFLRPAGLRHYKLSSRFRHSFLRPAGLRHYTLSSRFSPFIPQTCRSTSLYAVFTFFAIHSSDLPVYVIVHCLHVFRHSFPRPIEDYNWSPPSRIMKMLCTWTK